MLKFVNVENVDFKVIEKIINDAKTTKNKNCIYLEIPVSFDIETSSFYEGQNKRATMYIWCLNINRNRIIGRTWEEYVNLMNIINAILDNRKIVIYVHNLGYEFQFLRKLFEWSKVFARKKRKPMQAIERNIDYKCSYFLTNMSLNNVAKFQKGTSKIGDFDYNLLRHSKTVLTAEENQYVLVDTEIIIELIERLITEEGSITKIPLTQTGYVRNHMRKKVFPREKSLTNKRQKFTNIIKNLTLEEEEYRIAKRAYRGGSTHSNVKYNGIILENVSSFDIASSYPSVMYNEFFPMSKGEKIDLNMISKEDFEKYLKNYHCIFDITFYNLENKVTYDNPLSSHKCTYKRNVTENNGRIVTGEVVTTTLTEIDFSYYKLFYKWEKVKIHTLYTYVKGFLPKEYLEGIAELYANKTELKGIKEKEELYNKSKQLINALYGMMVTDINPADIIYKSDEWFEETDSNLLEKNITDYNNKKNRFNSYIWGVYITAYARRNLYRAIYTLKDDYIYSDTDSVKFLNYEKHADFFEKQNLLVEEKNKISTNFYKLQEDSYRPKDSNGKTQILGIWENDGEYSLFKTLGAKRYLIEDKKGNKKLTVSGLRKKAINVIDFNNFNIDLRVEAEESGRMTSYYGDEPFKCFMSDYQNNILEVEEKSFLHLEKSEFTLSIASQYLQYINLFR